MSNQRQPPLGEVDPSEGSVQDPEDEQGAQAANAEGQERGGLQVDPSEEPSNE